MTERLPEQFKERMKRELVGEYDAFIASYDEPRTYGLRCNLLKDSPEAFLNKMPFLLEKIDGVTGGFYYRDEERPGKHAYHEAGAYYIQEPSAMSAAVELDIHEGDVVLDLCAAPGGKSTQIAGLLNGKGLLLTNEIIKDRAMILSSNIERMGVRNAVVTSEPSDKLALAFPSFFNKILVDAPCSGEGMFRKDETAINEWSPDNVTMCAKRQLDILNDAASMLAPGGTLVYSTCTFSREENEDNAQRFLDANPDLELIFTKRLMPHKYKGEGHFVAKFKKQGEYVPLISAGSIFKDNKKGKKQQGAKNLTDADLKAFLENDMKICDTVVAELFKGACINTVRDSIFLTPVLYAPKVPVYAVRPGLNIATDLKNRIEPSHSLAISLRPHEVKERVDISLEDAAKFIAGETLDCDPGLKGFITVFVNGYSLGYAKAVNGTLKNHYPKGLRTIL